MSRIADPLPEEVLVSKDRNIVTLSWADGLTSSLSAPALRRACRCAWCTRDRVLDRFHVADEQAIATAEALGSHGLHLTFADGHARGIFPWAYLRDLADGTASAGRDRSADSTARELTPPL